MALLVCSQQLVSESSSTVGQTLRFSFQLRDATGRTAVDVSLVVLRPLLSYTEPHAAPAGVNASANELPSCTASGVDPVSGVGECSLVVDDGYFPDAGQAAASIVLQLCIG